MGDVMLPIRVYFALDKKNCKCGKLHIAYQQYIVYYFINKDWLGRYESMTCGLAYTDNDGFLHPLTMSAPDDNSVTWNYVRYGKVDGENCWRIDNFRPYTDIRAGKVFKEGHGASPIARREYHKSTVKIPPGKHYGLFFWTPYLRFMTHTIRKKDLLADGLIAVYRMAKIPAQMVRRGKAYIKVKVKPSYPIFLHGTRMLSRRLNYLINVSKREIGALMACSTLVDQISNLVTGQGRARYGYWWGEAEIRSSIKVRAAAASLGARETWLLRQELIGPVQASVKKQMARAKARSLRQIRSAANNLEQLITCKAHHFAYINYYNDAFQAWLINPKKPLRNPEKVRLSYVTAYRLLSRTEKAKSIFNSHVGPFLKTAEKDITFRKVLESVTKEASFLKTLHGEIVAVVEAFGFMRLSKELTKFRGDILGAMKYLEHQGLAYNVEDLRNALFKADIYKSRVDAKQFLPDTPKHISIRAFNKSVSGLKLMAAISVLNDSKKGIAHKIGAGKDCMDVGLDLMEAMKMPYAAQAVKIGGTVTAMADWTLTIQPLYAAADKSGLEFSYAVAEYSGKGIVMGGHILSLSRFLMGTNPYGLVIVAVGTAIEILLGTYKAIIEYRNPDYIRYIKAVKALKKSCQKGGTGGRKVWQAFSQNAASTAKDTAEAKRQLDKIDPGVRKNYSDAMNKYWDRKLSPSRNFGEGDRSLIFYYFHNKTWGVAESVMK